MELIIDNSLQFYRIMKQNWIAELFGTGSYYDDYLDVINGKKKLWLFLGVKTNLDYGWFSRVGIKEKNCSAIHINQFDLM